MTLSSRIAAASVLLAAAWLAAQSPTLEVRTRLVQVPTLVESATGELAFSLSAGDCVVTDNGVPQTVTLDTDAQHPLSLVLLMQTGDSAPREFGRYKRLETLLAALLGDPPNQVSIVAFDSKPEGATPFTSDIAQWSDAIDHPDEGDHGAAILDALAYALGLFRNQPAANRRAIILLSGPRDEGSKTSLKEIIRAAGETNTAIYPITFSPQETAFKDAFTQPPHLNPPLELNGSKQAYFDLGAPLAMILGAMRKNTTAELARLTGGETSGFTTEKGLADDLNTLTNHLRNGYMLSFTPSSATPGLHTLQVRVVNHPELTVSARANYWSADPQ
jgi:VWFA-related protein